MPLFDETLIRAAQVRERLTMEAYRRREHVDEDDLRVQPPAGQAGEFGGWGIVQSSGPGGAADYDDHRYWVAPARPATGGDPETDALAFTLTGEDAFTATNIAEAATQRHLIRAGTVVHYAVTSGYRWFQLEPSEVRAVNLAIAQGDGGTGCGVGPSWQYDITDSVDGKLLAQELVPRRVFLPTQHTSFVSGAVGEGIAVRVGANWYLLDVFRVRPDVECRDCTGGA